MLIRRRPIFLAFAIATACGPAQALSADACDVLQIAVATTPVIEQTPGKLKAAKSSARLSGAADLLIIGDSIAANWKQTAPTDFPDQAVKVYGVRGERTQELLWRIYNHTPNVSPKNILLVIGTNNLSDRTSEPCGVSSGIEAAVGAIRKLWPDAKILVMPILPRGEGYMFRDTDRQEVNSFLRARLSGDDLIKVLEIDERELTCVGQAKICGNFRRDNLHPTNRGYAVLSRAVAGNLIVNR